MAEVVLKDIKKVYPYTSSDRKKNTHRVSNLQITDDGVVAVCLDVVGSLL